MLTITLLVLSVLIVAVHGVMAWGRTQGDDLMTAVVVDRQTNTRYYQIIDLNQDIRLLRPFGLTFISNTTFIGSGRCLSVLAGRNPQEQHVYLLDVPEQELRRLQGETSIFASGGGGTAIDVDRSGFDCRVESIDSLRAEFSAHPMLDALPPGLESISYFLPSPNRQWAAFHVLTERSQDTYTFHPASGSLYQLNTDDFFITTMDWSPDSRRLAYTVSLYTSLPGANAYLADADGSNVRSLGFFGSQPLWSPDGRYIAWKAWNEIERQNATGFFLMQPDVSNTQVRYIPVAESPAWSADGQQFAYILRRSNPRRTYDIDLFVAPLRAPTEGRSLTSSDYDVITFAYW